MKKYATPQIVLHTFVEMDVMYASDVVGKGADLFEPDWS